MTLKILITGICGFVGSEVARTLMQCFDSSGIQIIGIDNLSRSGSCRNRESLIRHGIHVLHGDIRNASDLESIHDVDWVVDAAANPSVLSGVDGKSSSRQLVEHNLAGTINLLELCKREHAGFILLSTSRVYSIQPLASLEVVEQGQAFQPTVFDQHIGLTAQGISESFPTVPPVSLYGSTKLASEHLAIEYGRAFDFPVWVNRCGVMAGAGQFGRADQGIFAFWLHSWREQRPLKYIGFGGDGFQVRDCLHPRDLVPLLRKQFDTENDGRLPIVNVSGGRDSAMSLRQLSDWCSDRWGRRTVAADLASRPFDLPWVVLDHQLATESWGWQPSVHTEEILEEVADFADSQPNWIAIST